MAFSSVLAFLLPTHSVDCAVHLLLSHSRALLVSSALFLQFTALKCPFDGPFTALKCPFQMAPCPFENLGRTLYAWCQFKMTSLKCPYLSKPQVIILTVHIYIAMKHCISHKTSSASYSPAHKYTSSQILHIYGISVVICGGLPTRQAASKSPQTTTETS